MTVALAACEVGPDYERPPVATIGFVQGAGGLEAKPAGRSRQSRPVVVDLQRSAARPLEAQVEVSNENLNGCRGGLSRGARHRRRGTRWTLPDPVGRCLGAALRSGRGRQFQRQQHGLARRTGTEPVQRHGECELGSRCLGGRIRRTIESDVASAQASAADLAAATLSAQSLLATNYLQLRVADELKRLLDDTTVAFGRSLQITINRYQGGIAARSDVASARAQYESTRAQAINVGVQRAALEHAIAVLIGKPPAELTVAMAKFTPIVPVTPPGLPSTLLERRPDIAGAERRVAAANAQIGVAVAAYYPDITLSASYGVVSSAIDTLFRAANGVWAVGPSLAQTVFDAGLRSRPGRGGARILRSERRQLPPDRAHRLPADRGPARGFCASSSSRPKCRMLRWWRRRRPRR